ncbi:cell wall synthesis protein Wag31 [Phytohabitans flavus]|uniref:Cell wall synthesis protein Wag31 n=1 Tax=Phytohabitans flavus TaxID=1076124 RepID=A0A6F8XLZ0_9ACTN|nr:DivIVA domain-containing protein [Phytohabitans flavus]BCB74823.1 cell wall synthesis protein Wag31 [Phytohabitans flavus]
MPLTPADVHNISFKKPSIGKRGYDEEQVDAFLDELEHELIRLIEENNDLRILMAHDGAQAGAGADQQLATALDEMTAQLDRVQREKAAAEQAARATQAELARAHTQGAPMAARDRQQASEVLTMAERTADTHLGEAQHEARDLLSDARSTARQITGDALAKADALEQDARQRHHEAMSGLEAKRTAAQHQIEDLEAFEREYRSRLRAHVESQVRDLDGRGPGLDQSDEVDR